MINYSFIHYLSLCGGPHPPDDGNYIPDQKANQDEPQNNACKQKTA